MTQLVSAARIGRSLGVHLILATQKPSGVVDDQIWSNSRFRVCLKVQEKADSMEVIKRPDAAALTATGRFYIQVGFNELFDDGPVGLGRRAVLPGRPRREALRRQRRRSSTTSAGRCGRRGSTGAGSRSSSPAKQLDEVTRYLVQVAADEGRHGPAALARADPRADLRRRAARQVRPRRSRPDVLDPIVGEYDDPANQRQALLTVPLVADGNAVVYGSAGSGKTTFVADAGLSLLEEHDPTQVHVYLLDFEAETLRAFQNAPHVGDVLCSYDEEKVENLFKLLADEIARRRQLFADYGGDFDSYAEAERRARSSPSWW